MQRHFFAFTLDSIMAIFFGENSDTLGGGSSVYGDAYDSAHRNIMEFFFKTLSTFCVVKFLPWPFGGASGLAFQWCMARHPLFKEFKKALATLDAESVRLIRQCRAAPDLRERRDLLALFLKAEESENDKLSTQWLKDIVLNFVIAGRDTTACALSWMFYLLATNPHVQA